jgi:amino acid adenylation domain-containing protein
MSSVAKISPEKLALLEQMLREEGLAEDSRQTIPRRKIFSPVPQSSAQQRLWFLEQLSPGTPLYNIDTAMRLPFAVDIDVMQRALDEIVRRHESLRTVFRADDGEPVQVILSESTVPLELIDLTTDDPGERESEAARINAQACSKPFDLATGPLVAAALSKLSDDDYLLAARMHHIVSDGWSVNVFLIELSTLYDAFARGEPSPLPELPVQYADYAAWEREALRRGAFDEQLAAWKKRLENAPPLQLPYDFPRPRMQSVAGATQFIRVGHRVTERLSELSRQNDATMFMTLLAGFEVLLARYTGQEDIVLGTPISGRGHPELEPLIGFFVNNLVLRTDVSGDPEFVEVVRRVRSVVLSAMANSDLPFAKLVEAVRPTRDTTQTALFSVVFTLLTQEEFQASGPELDPTPGTAKFDLTMSCLEANGDIIIAAEYSTDLFRHDTIRRMLLQFGTVLEGAADRPHFTISQMPLLTAEERRDLLGSWQGQAVQLFGSECAHELVQQCARQHPDRTAITDGRVSLTYQELDRKANALALLLREAGVRDGTIVPLLLWRSAELVVSQLAVLKAGGAFAPVDPSEPRQRLAQVLDELSSPILIAGVETDFSRPTLRIDEILPALDGPARLEFSAGAPEATAYVIYTSGSTGKPKGVRIAHRSLVNLIEWHGRTYNVTCDDHATLVASPAFDASVWEIWPYLAAGASLHVVDSASRVDPSKLWAFLADREITIAFLPTPLAELMIQMPLPAKLRLRALLTGGDRLHRCPRRNVPFTLFNHYGPTENTVISTWGAVDPDPAREPHIGRPIDNVRAYVLDRWHNLVPTGVYGELFLGGVGLASGYLGSNEAAAAKFIPSPFAAGERLYATGDIVRWRGDGNLEFLGRGDSQVKIRGYRIELGEIESVLCDHERVREAVVIARPQRGSGLRLAAYVSANGDKAVTPRELQQFVSERLPAYMVPSAFVVLDRLPLTPNGKLDRDALPEPPETKANPAPVAYRIRTEARIAAIWSEVLGVGNIGPHENFFDLGGHSLLLVALQAKLQEAFDRPIAVVDLFRYPTVAAFAACLTEQQDGHHLAAEAHSRVDKQASTRRATAAGRARARNLLEDKHDGR